MSGIDPIVYNEPDVEIPVEFRGKKYTLIQADGGAAAKFRSAIAKCAKFGPDGRPVSASGVGDVEPLLVSLCLRFEGKMVSEEEVRKFPAPFVRQLFDAAKKISHLNEMTDGSLEGLKKQRDELEAKIKEQEQQEDERKNAETGSGGGSD